MLAKWTPVPHGVARPVATMPVFEELFRDADRLFESALAMPYARGAAATWAPADLLEREDGLELTLDLPGHDPKAISIQVEGDVVTLRSSREEPEAKQGAWLLRERPRGQVARSFVLPDTVDAGKTEASFKDGVLTLWLPKREEAKPKSITVKVSG